MTDRTVSVVVAFHDARSTIERCIESLQGQVLDDWDVELIAVDDGSHDDSAKLAEACGVHLVRQPRGGAYVARNRGVRESTGSIVAFTDADCVAHPGWLAGLLDAFADPHVQLVLGKRVAPVEDRALSRLLMYEHARDAYVLEGEDPEIYYGHTNNLAVRRETFEQLGPFVERMRGSDTVLVRRVVDGRGCEAVRYRSDAVVTHLELGGLRAYYRKVFTYGRHRRLTAELGSARPLSTRDRIAIADRAVAELRGGMAAALELRLLLAGGVIAWWLGSISAFAPGRLGRAGLS